MKKKKRVTEEPIVETEPDFDGTKADTEGEATTVAEDLSAPEAEGTAQDAALQESELRSDEGEAGVPVSEEIAEPKERTKARVFFARTKQWAHRWFIDAFNGMAQGLFVTLIAGTILMQIGKWIGANGFGTMVRAIAAVAQMLMGAGIGVGIAHALKASKLVMFSAAVAGLVGAFANNITGGSFSGQFILNVADPATAKALPGNPIGAYICAIIAVEVAKLYAGRTKLDIILVPLGMMIVSLASIWIAWPFIKLIDLVGQGIALATEAVPFVMGVVISVVMGILLTMPTSSAAIWIAVCSGVGASEAMLLAGGAAVVGCAAHMVGFAVASFRENRWSGLISQGIGTSMLQIPNIMKRPVIMVPAIVASAVVGPLSTCVFRLYCDATGGGMGTSGLVGVFSTITTSLNSGLSPWLIGFGVPLLMFVLPALIAWGVSELLRHYNIIRPGDMKLED